MARIAPQQIKGLQFAIDRKTVEEVVTVDVKNCLVDLDGPRSAFATSRSARQTDFVDFPESFTVGLETFQFLRNAMTNKMAVMQFNWVERQWELILENAFTAAYITYKSTNALVGGKQYFCNRGWGVWERDPVTSIWTDVTANFPTNTFYITESAGRCIALADGIAAWSAIDDANDFTPSTSTGAGFQSLSLIGTPENDFDYRGLQKVADGFLVFMRQGVMKSTSIDSLIQFRHRVVKDKLIALNGWSFARIDDDALVFLTTKGLYVTNGATFEVWQPLLSEEIKLNVLPKLIADANGQIQIHYSQEKDWLFVSITENATSRVFEKAFVSYLPRGEWGMFNELHRGFFDVDITGDGAGFQQDQLAYLTVDGEIALFQDNINHVELEPLADTSPAALASEVYYSDKLYDIPNVELSTHIIANCNMRITASSLIHDRLAAEHVQVPEANGYYEVLGLQNAAADDDFLDTAFKFYDEVNNIAVSQTLQFRSEALVYGHTKQDLNFRTLDCKLTVGLLRLTDDQQSDQFSLISNVAISMSDAATANTVIVDWLNDFNPDLTVDWMNDFPTDVVVDWGLNAASSSSYTASIFASLDGYNDFSANEILLDLAKTEGRTRFYSTNMQGLYVLINIDGSKVNDYVHLKHLELTGILTGRL